MKLYTVYSAKANEANFDYQIRHNDLKSAKEEIKRLWAAGYTDAYGNINQTYKSGDWKPLGEIDMSK